MTNRFFIFIIILSGIARCAVAEAATGVQSRARRGTVDLTRVTRLARFEFFCPNLGRRVYLILELAYLHVTGAVGLFRCELK